MLWCCLEVAIVLNSFWSLGILQIASIILCIETSMVTVANLQANLGAFENIFNIFDVSISVHVVLANSLDIIPSFTETWKASLSLNMAHQCWSVQWFVDPWFGSYLAHPFGICIDVTFNVTNVGKESTLWSLCLPDEEFTTTWLPSSTMSLAISSIINWENIFDNIGSESIST